MRSANEVGSGTSRCALSQQQPPSVCHALVALSLACTSYGTGWAGQPEAPRCDLAGSLQLAESGRQAARDSRHDVAASLLRQAFEACPMQPGVLVELSYAHARRRDFPAAIGAAEEYLEHDPTSVPGRLALANALFMGRRLREAREQSLKILAADPGNAAALKLRANSEYLLGDLEQAEQTFIELLERHPNDAEAAYMLGRIYYEDGRLDYAVGQFQRVLKLDPKNYKAYDNLGLCYEARGEVELATRHFLTAIKLVETDYPDYDWPYANLANLLLGQGNAEKAFSAAVKAATRNPHSARNCYLAGKALSMLNQTDLSIKWLERSASLDAGYAEPLYLLARLYNQTGDEEKARDALQRFREAKARSSGKGR